MSIASRRRAIIGAQKGGGLPSEYQQVEYISQSSSTPAYCNTGLNVPYQFPLEVEFEFYRTGGGSYNSYVFTLYGGGSIYLGAQPRTTLELRNGNSTISFNLSVTNNVRSKAIYTINSDGVDASLDTNGTIITNSVSITPVDWSNYTVFLFASAGNGAMKGRLYSGIIKSNGVVVVNMIPCRRKSDDAIGVYDTVSKQFFSSQSSTQFTGGPDVT